MKATVKNDDVKGRGYALLVINFAEGDDKPNNDEVFSVAVKSHPSNKFLQLQSAESGPLWLEGSAVYFDAPVREWTGLELTLELGPYITSSFEDKIHSFSLKGSSSSFSGLKAETYKISKPPREMVIQLPTTVGGTSGETAGTGGPAVQPSTAATAETGGPADPTPIAATAETGGSADPTPVAATAETGGPAAQPSVTASGGASGLADPTPVTAIAETGGPAAQPPVTASGGANGSADQPPVAASGGTKESGVSGPSGSGSEPPQGTSEATDFNQLRKNKEPDQPWSPGPWSPPPKGEKSRVALVVFPIVAALLLAGVGAWLFFFKDKGEAPESSSQVETAKLEPSQPEGTPSSPASQAPQGSPGEPSKPSPDQNAGQSAADPSKAPSKEAGQKKLTPVDEARKLLREGAPEAELVAAVKRLDGQPGAEDAVFIILRKLAPSSPEYRMRFAAFYDPLDTRPAGSVPKNAKHAYDEYEEAKKAGVKSAADRQDALLEWAEAREGSADEGVRELLRVLDKDLF